eukprot:GHUV01010268.1.p1 GENE.GHUV01010268.1~~GHUV01010268.1.p1  ORF type:complete len:631 (+),score=180.97 GHUV01010268.1:56-1948(+)
MLLQGTDPAKPIPRPQSALYAAQLQQVRDPAEQQDTKVAAKFYQRKLLQETSEDQSANGTAPAGTSSTAAQPSVAVDSQQQQQVVQAMAASATSMPTANGTGMPSTAANKIKMPSATTAQMRKAQVGTPNDIPTNPEGNIPVITTSPPAAVPLYITPNATFESTTVVSMDQELLQIPQSFLGISHEWTHVEELNNIPGYKDILNMLTQYGSGPMIIRVGGGSTDKLTTIPPQYVYQALAQVYNEIGAQFILGVNFESSDVELARGQLDAARSYMPPGSVITFEIGNEPNYYEGTKKDSQGQPLTALQYVRSNLIPDWTSLAKQLSCPCGTTDCCTYKQFAGPVWGHVNVYPATIKWFLDQTGSFVNLTTLHWYKATKESYNTPTTLLEEAPIRQEMNNLRALVQTSQGFGIPLRIAEMNTVSNSGRVGVSNVFAAALWTLDGCFEVAATGAVGVNLHQGSGQNLYTAILRWYNQNVLSPPVLRPPFYGMLMFQQAVKAGSKLLGTTQISGGSGVIKVWPLVDVYDRELRIVVVNKHPSEAGSQTLTLNLLVGDGYDSAAEVSRLVARGEDPLSATSSITIGGLYYAVGGVEQGEEVTEIVPMTPTADGRVSWTIYMPPGSAALVTVECQK